MRTDSGTNDILSLGFMRYTTAISLQMSDEPKMMLRKRYIIETINDLLKNKAQLVHSRHRSITNFLVNLVAVPGAYCFFENKPEALQGYCIEDSKQLTLF